MRKNLFLLATATIALASCTNDEFLGGDNSPNQGKGEISFALTKAGMTKGDITGAEAANLLGKKFVVDGSKGTGATAYADKLVFDQYNVEWGTNSANTTESNTHDWEYVGVTKHTHSSVAEQTVKYWDYSEALYDFIAYSTGGKTADYTDGATVADGSVQISAITRTNIGNDGVTTGKEAPVYTVKGKATDLASFYITDVNTVKKANYGAPVTLKFRSLAAKVRIAFYETIPGYSVNGIEFYPEASAATTDFTGAASAGSVYASTTAYGQTGTMSVYYPVVGTNNENAAGYNEAVVKISGTSDGSKDLSLGTVNYSAKKEKAEDGNTTADNDYDYIGRAANAASFVGNPDNNYYTVVLPADQGAVMNLRVNYTLTSTDGSKEKIVVKGATAQVPAVYTSWLPNYAYTYIFKISNNTNGWTGSSSTGSDEKAGLYPITFDAVVVNAEDAKQQETITTVSTKSITTAQWDATNNKFLANQNEYSASNEIYVMVNEGGTLTTNAPTAANNVALYIVTDATGAKVTAANATEADIVDALKYQSSVDGTSGAITGRNGLILTPAKNGSDNLLAVTDGTNKKFYNEDGTQYTPAAGAAAYFTPAATTKYAFVYNTAAPGTATAKYDIVSMTAGTNVKGYYKYKTEAATGTYVVGTTYYTDEACTQVANTSGWVAGVTNVGDGAQPAVLYADATEYNAAKGTSLSDAEFTALSESDKTKTAAKPYYVINKTADLVEITSDSETAVTGVAYFVKYNYYGSANYSTKVIKIQ